jgi:hypothetical protein
MLTQLLPVLLFLLGPSNAIQAKTPDKAPKASIDTELAALAKDLDKADKKDVSELLYAFARKHLPTKDKVAVFVSADKKICVAIGATGTEKSPNGADVEFTPTGTQYNIAVGGKGFDSKTGDGPNGGSVTLKAKSQGKCILLGGAGGNGADAKAPDKGKKGGTGGNVWYGDNLKPEDSALGGKGGLGGSPGGGGGGGGGTGPKPAK